MRLLTLPLPGRASTFGGVQTRYLIIASLVTAFVILGAGVWWFLTVL